MTQDPTFKAVPLGGLGRIGGNMMVYESDEDLVVVDCGVLFPSESEPGVDSIIPDVSYIKARKEKLRGYVITHGHEDHFGALHFILPDLEAPVYATDFTRRIIEHKLKDRIGEAHGFELRTIEDGKTFDVGKLRFTPIPVTHSIPGAVMFAIDTPVGKVVHTGDFKLDPEPMDGRTTDEDVLGELGKAGVTALFSDSTNAERDGHTWSEREVADALVPLIADAPNRVVVSTFSSNVHRIQAVVEASVKAERHVMPVGSSMERFMQLGLDTGQISAPPGTIVDPDNFGYFARDQLTILATGCQGEPMAALYRIAHGTHNKVSLDPGDRLIMSARRIPGNERPIGRMLNRLIRIGIELIDDRKARVHTSGHAHNDEQRRILDLCKPRHFVPLHGEYRHMVAHARLAVSAGLPKDRVHVLEDGLPIQFFGTGDSAGAARLEEVAAGYVYVDGDGIGDIGEVVLKDRRILAEVGMVVVVAALDAHGQLVSGPEILSRGVMHIDESQDMIDAIAEEVADKLEELDEDADDDARNDCMRKAVRRFFKREHGRRPLVVPLVLYVD